MSIPTFREVQDDITAQLRDQGFLAAILVDLSPLANIERTFGGTAFRALRSQVDPLLQDMRERFRQDDFITRDEREGDRFLLFLSGPRRGDTPFRSENLRKLVERVEQFLNPRVGRLTLPYLKERPTLVAGYGLVLWSPLESPERQVLRLVDDAIACADMRARVRDREQRERLLEIIQNREIWTAFQPIVELGSGRTMGWEGLSRGPRGSDLELPIVLFGRAARYGVTEELERACRRQAFVDWQVLGQTGRLFVNTVPATVRDTSFLGRGVLDYLGPDLAPSAVTLEITERQVIENLNLYREAMHSFTDLGFSFAIDDVGAGYSGLETVAVLKPAYLKIDIALVRDVHQKKVSQQVVKAILDMGEGLGATVIAEGIQAREEVEALRDLGVIWGQGYFYARPVDPYAVPRRGPGEVSVGRSRSPWGLAPLLLAALVPACGGSGGSPSSGTPASTSDAGASASSNPCTAALAATGGVAASAAGRSPKSDGYGHDDRDPREFLALHLLPRDGGVSARAASSSAARSGDIAVVSDDGSIVIGANPFDLGGAAAPLRPERPGRLRRAARERRLPPRPRPARPPRRRRHERGASRLRLPLLRGRSRVRLRELRRQPDLRRGATSRPALAPSAASSPARRGSPPSSRTSTRRPAGGVFVNAAPDAFTVTWCAVPDFDATGKVTAQASLLPGGAVEIRIDAATTLEGRGGGPVARGDGRLRRGRPLRRERRPRPGARPPSASASPPRPRSTSSPPRAASTRSSPTTTTSSSSGATRGSSRAAPSPSRPRSRTRSPASGRRS